eukprot:752233-Hanusia_phi.AAC.2
MNCGEALFRSVQEKNDEMSRKLNKGRVTPITEVSPALSSTRLTTRQVKTSPTMEALLKVIEHEAELYPQMISPPSLIDVARAGSTWGTKSALARDEDVNQRDDSHGTFRCDPGEEEGKEEEDKEQGRNLQCLTLLAVPPVLRRYRDQPNGHRGGGRIHAAAALHQLPAAPVGGLCGTHEGPRSQRASKLRVGRGRGRGRGDGGNEHGQVEREQGEDKRKFHPHHRLLLPRLQQQNHQRCLQDRFPPLDEDWVSFLSVVSSSRSVPRLVSVSLPLRRVWLLADHLTAPPRSGRAPSGRAAATAGRTRPQSIPRGSEFLARSSSHVQYSFSALFTVTSSHAERAEPFRNPSTC